MKIWPSILAADLLNLSAQIQILIDHGIGQLHLDIMDNHYVPNLSFSPDLCRQIKQKFPSIKIDVHLMTKPAEALIHQFGQASADRIAIHADCGPHLDFYLESIKQYACLAGLAINPGESIHHLDEIFARVDYVLMMTVNPGFGGQKLIPYTIAKVAKLRQAFPKLPIMVDGGIDLNNISQLIAAGASDFVIGSALFKANHFPKCITAYLERLQGV